MSLTMREKASSVRKKMTGKLGILVAIGILQIVVAFNVFENGCPDLAAGGATWTTGSPACPNGSGKRKRHDPRMALASRAGVVFSEYN